MDTSSCLPGVENIISCGYITLDITLKIDKNFVTGLNPLVQGTIMTQSEKTILQVKCLNSHYSAVSHMN